jgi:hypothetical protein
MEWVGYLRRDVGVDWLPAFLQERRRALNGMVTGLAPALESAAPAIRH